MLVLYDREECPQCRVVRRFLARHDVVYVNHTVPRLHAARTDLIRLLREHGRDPAIPEVPTIEHDGRVVQGVGPILHYLQEHFMSDYYGDPAYGLTRKLEGVSYADAIPAVKAALATEGFGVLTEIDVKATLKKKIDVDHRPYVILGACNPPLAHQALTAEPAIGLLLPCNVIVTEDDGGNAIVSAIDPKAMFSVVGRDDVAPIADEVREKLRRALAAIEA